MGRYRYTLSSVIRVRIARADGGAGLTAAQYHPFIRCQASQWRGGSVPSSRLASLTASSFRLCLSSHRITLIARSRLRIRAWYLTRSQRVETLLSTSLHVAAEIHAFFRAYLDLYFGRYLHNSVKSLSSLTVVVGVRRGGRLRLPRYSMCSLRGAP